MVSDLRNVELNFEGGGVWITGIFDRWVSHANCDLQLVSGLVFV